MKSQIAWLMATLKVALLVQLAAARAPVLHRVGGDKYGWKFNVNFSDWASHERFYVGDWLYFGFDKHTFSVLEVNRTAYKTCTENNFITNITRGGRDVFNLTVARSYYFISGRGYCSRGLKLALTAVDAPPDPPTNNSLVKTTPAFSDDATTTTTLLQVPLLIALALASIFIFI